MKRKILGYISLIAKKGGLVVSISLLGGLNLTPFVRTELNHSAAFDRTHHPKCHETKELQQPLVSMQSE